jgi:hypothetical protein
MHGGEQLENIVSTDWQCHLQGIAVLQCTMRLSIDHHLRATESVRVPVMITGLYLGLATVVTLSIPCHRRLLPQGSATGCLCSGYALHSWVLTCC